MRGPRRKLAKPIAQADLFGRPATPPKDGTPVTLPLTEVAATSTSKAWFLVPIKGAAGRAGFVPRSEVTRGEGDRAGFFTMPRWLAAERGWI